MKIISLFIIVLLFIPLPAILILYFTDKGSSIRQLITPFTTSLTLLLGWVYTIHQNNKNFTRSETVKHKDKLVLMIESFFDDLAPMIESRRYTEQKIRDFISDQVSNLEFKHNMHYCIYGKNTVLLSDDSIAKLRMVWKLNTQDYDKQEQSIQKLREDILQEIEDNYVSWLMKELNSKK